MQCQLPPYLNSSIKYLLVSCCIHSAILRTRLASAPCQLCMYVYTCQDSLTAFVVGGENALAVLLISTCVHDKDLEVS